MPTGKGKVLPAHAMKTYKEGRDITLLDTIYPGKSPGAQ
jgi:hypothetical protein